jgi:hypothetical protein
MPRYPNPDDQRINRNPPAFLWSALPEDGRQGPPPKLPSWHQWAPATKKWWTELWSKPQAVMWDPTGSTLWTLARLMDDLFTNRLPAKALSAEIRAHEDHHGLNPKAMLQLRWRIVPNKPEEGEVTSIATGTTGSRRRLKL